MSGWAVFKDVVLFLVAVYAAVLSTINFWKSAQKERRSVHLLIATAMPTYGSELGPPYAQLKVVNNGHRVVSISYLTLRLPDGKRIWPLTSDTFPGMADSQFPARLAEGEVAHRFMSYADIGSALIGHGFTSKVKLTPVCEDTTGGQYEGKSWEVDPHEFVRMSQS